MNLHKHILPTGAKKDKDATAVRCEELEVNAATAPTLIRACRLSLEGLTCSDCVGTVKSQCRFCSWLARRNCVVAIAQRLHTIRLLQIYDS